MIRCRKCLVVRLVALAAFWGPRAFGQSLADFDNDRDQDLADLKRFVACLHAGGPSADLASDCGPADRDADPRVDLRDVAAFQRTFSPWSRIVETSPANGESMVALTRETIISIPNKLQIDPHTITNDNVFATFAGNKLTLVNGMPRVTADGKRIKLFYDPRLPPRARVRATIDGTKIIDVNGYALDADGDGSPGGVARIDFDTCTMARIPNTDVYGYVFASEQTGPKGENLPLEGVTIRVDGFPSEPPCDDGVPEGEFCAQTDATGYFILDDTPAPEFFVHVDGTTVTSVGGKPSSMEAHYECAWGSRRFCIDAGLPGMGVGPRC